MEQAREEIGQLERRSKFKFQVNYWLVLGDGNFTGSLSIQRGKYKLLPQSLVSRIQ
jgi:hypothetical protein